VERSATHRLGLFEVVPLIYVVCEIEDYQKDFEPYRTDEKLINNVKAVMSALRTLLEMPPSPMLAQKSDELLSAIRDLDISKIRQAQFHLTDWLN